MMSPRPRFPIRLTVALLTAGLIACDNSPTGSIHGGPPVTLGILASVGESGVTLVVVQVEGLGIPVPIVANFEVVDGTAQGTIKVPPGSVRIFTARAFNAEAQLTHEGSVIEDVRPGMSAVRIPLVPRGVGVPIETVVSAYQITIDPASAALETGGTLLFTATVATLDNGPVAIAPGELMWGSTNPAVVQVDGTGLATAMHQGSAQIVVSYEGVAAAATVVVDEGLAPLTVSISPETAYTTTTLTCSAEGAVEPYTYAWTVNGNAAGSGPTLAGSAFVRGDVVQCTATSHPDGGPSVSESASVVIQNSPPVVTTVTLSPAEPTTNDNLTCTVTVSDADGDMVSVLYAWTINGSLGGGTSSSLSSSNFTTGDSVQCIVTPHDGIDAGEPAMSAVVVIQ